MPFPRRAALLALLAGVLAAPAWAEPIAMPSGLVIDPPEDLDVTWQVIPAYDDAEKVLAGWDHDKLRWFLITEQLPPGALDAKAYLQALAAELSRVGARVELGPMRTLRLPSGLVDVVVQLRRPAVGDHAALQEVAHHLSDGRTAWFAVASATSETPLQEVFDGSVAALASAQVARRSASLAGTWSCDDVAANGRVATTRIVLADDASFTTDVRLEDKVLFTGAGRWERAGDTLRWHYGTSEPSLPADRREDVDDIVSADGALLVLKSRSSGLTHDCRRTQ